MVTSAREILADGRAALIAILKDHSTQIDAVMDMLNQLDPLATRGEVLAQVSSVLEVSLNTAGNFMTVYDAYSTSDPEDVERVVQDYTRLLSGEEGGAEIASKHVEILQRLAERTEAFLVWDKSRAVQDGLLPRINEASIQVQARPLYNAARDKIEKFFLATTMRISYRDDDFNGHELLLELTRQDAEMLITEIENAKKKLDVLADELGERVVP